MSLSKKNDLQRDFVAGVSEAPSSPRFLFGGGLANFVGSESGQLYRLKLLQNMVCNRTQHTPTTIEPCRPASQLSGTDYRRISSRKNSGF